MQMAQAMGRGGIGGGVEIRFDERFVKYLDGFLGKK